MYRNINSRTDAFLGPTKLIITGADVPSTGTHGPGFLYPLVQANPGIASKVIRGKIVRRPATGVLANDPNSAFSFTPAGLGTESFDIQPMVMGAPFGPVLTASLVSKLLGRSFTIRNIQVVIDIGF